MTAAVLLDGNVLVALSVVGHVHHRSAAEWFGGQSRPFATTPITQGTLLRLLLRNGVPAPAALSVLEGITRDARQVFWPDDRPYDRAALRGVLGHRQVTDSYLAALARAHGGRLASFDQGLAATHADVVDLLVP
jgi:toxin-antitoxin system PIN domain toxin